MRSRPEDRTFTLVVGRAGTGKTHRCLASIAARLSAADPWDGPPLLFVVPDQATAQTERALLHALGGPGVAFSRAHVLSFRRLAHRVLEETGGAAKPTLGGLGKQMLLKRVLEDLLDEGRLAYFGSSSRRLGFLSALQGTLAELRRYRVEPSVLGEHATAIRDAGHAPLASKIEDLARIDGAFRRRLETRFTDPEDVITLAASRLPRASLTRGAHVWLDGFVGFTPQEYAFIEALLAVVGDVEAAVCLDPELAREGGGSSRSAFAMEVFEPTLETYRRLRAAAVASGREPRVIELDTPRRFSGSPSMTALEACLTGCGSEPASSSAAVTLVEAPDRRREVEAAALECLRLCREEGYRFRDFAVLSRDASLYADLVTATFREFGIPVFVDRRRSLSHHPAAELVRSALHVVARRWPADAVIRYLKTDLVVGESERIEVDLLERYVRANGVRGDAFMSDAPWGRRRSPSLDEDRPVGEEEAARHARLDAFRRRALEPLVAFDRALGCGGARLPAVEITRRLFEHMQALDVQGRLAAWAAEPRPAGAGSDVEAAVRGNRQAWEGIVRLLEEAAEVLAIEPLGVADYADVIEAGLDELSEALPPPALDQVLLGSVERSRHPELRAAFVLGLNDGLFPRVGAEDAVLCDADRERLAAAGIEIAPTTETELFHERYYFYIAMTRARDRVVASHSRTDERGKPLAPSSFWALLRGATPAAAPPAPPADLATAVTPARLAGAVAASFRRAVADAPAPRLDVYLAMRADPRLRPEMATVFAALAAAPPGTISRDSVRALYGATLEATVTQLEDFGKCPFMHFARHGLCLNAREDFDLDPRDIGSFCHAVLQVYADSVKAAGLRWVDVDEAARARLLGESVALVAPRLRGPAFGRSGRDRHFLDEVRGRLDLAIAFMTAGLCASGFEPAAFELGFGGRAGSSPPLEITMPGGRVARVTGKIDRVDMEGAGNPRETIAVDYKLSVPKSFERRMAGGLVFQLQVYLLALERLGPVFFGARLKPRGSFYQAFTPAPQELSFDEEVPAAGTPEFLACLAKTLKPKGIGDDSGPRGDLAPLLGYAGERLGLWAERILEGRCGPHPYRMGKESACNRCDFLDVCRFESRRHPSRRIPHANAREALAWMIANPGDREGSG